MGCSGSQNGSKMGPKMGTSLEGVSGKSPLENGTRLTYQFGDQNHSTWWHGMGSDPGTRYGTKLGSQNHMFPYSAQPHPLIPKYHPKMVPCLEGVSGKSAPQNGTTNIPANGVRNGVGEGPKMGSYSICLSVLLVQNDPNMLFWPFYPEPCLTPKNW